MREIAHIRATMLGRFALQQTGMKEPQMVSLAGRSGRLWTLVAYLILHHAVVAVAADLRAAGIFDRLHFLPGDPGADLGAAVRTDQLY